MSAPYYADELVTVYAGDCLDVLPTLPDASVDAVVCDPPYGLEFMGKGWDGADGFRRSLNGNDAGRESVFGRTSRTSPEYSTGRGVRVAAERADEMTPAGQGHTGSKGPYLAARVDSVRVAGLPFQEWCAAWAAECLRVLKPGGHLLAFGGTRTYHRLACAVEDAGFEIRDSISWLYGSGFPKSLDVSKAIDKAAGAEREVVGTVAARMPQAQAAGWGNPGVDEFRDARRGTVEMPVTAAATDDAARWTGWGTALKPAHEPIVVARKPTAGTIARNVLQHGTGALNISACRVGTSGATTRSHQAEFQSEGKVGEVHATRGYRTGHGVLPIDAGRWPTNVLLDESQAEALDAETGVLTSGANPTRRGSDKFRNAYGDFTGQEECTAARGADSGGASRFFPTFHYEPKAPTSERPTADGVLHPTVKPLDLMRWLVRLVTPPGGLVLDPFLGSGTTAEACVIEGFRCIGIERETDYLPLIVARLTKPLECVLDFGEVSG